MKILTDTHTHTTVSSHAYSTLKENAAAAKAKGLEIIAMTNHGPQMEDGPHIWHFMNISVLPDEIDGIKVLHGAEVNILNPSGEVDLPDNVLKKLGMVITSIHTQTYDCEEEKDCTKAWLNVLENPYIDLLGHPGRGNFPFDRDKVIKKAAEKDVCVEINVHTLKKPDRRETCREIALCCKKYNAKIMVNSDAHYCDLIGDFDDAIAFLSEIDFPEELVVNRSKETLISYLKTKNKNVDYSKYI